MLVVSNWIPWCDDTIKYYASNDDRQRSKIIFLPKLSRFAENELANLQLAANERWGFDFSKCVPMTDNKNYIWERVPPTNPEMYTIIRGAHLRETSTTPNYNDLLLDERANRANMERMDLCGDELNSSDESLCNSPTSKVVPVLIVSPGKRGKQRQPKITGKFQENFNFIFFVFNQSKPMTVENI